MFYRVRSGALCAPVTSKANLYNIFKKYKNIINNKFLNLYIYGAHSAPLRKHDSFKWINYHYHVTIFLLSQHLQMLQAVHFQEDILDLMLPTYVFQDYGRGEVLFFLLFLEN